MDDKVEPILEKTKTLIIRRLPAELKPEDQEDLLRHFGAEYVRCMGSSGRLKNVAFATYANVKEAEAALRRLHQLEVLGSRLVVEFSSSKYSDLHPTELPPIKKQSVISDDSSNKKPEQCKRESTEDRKQSLLDKVHAISPKWGVNYPLDPRLRYAYPAPTLTILTNIANAMAAVPRFYVQVLHLMNKMNLPAPFGLPTLTPPLPLGVQPPQPPDMPAPPMPQEDMDFSSSTESELESEDEDTVKKSTTEAGKRARKRERRYASRKRLRLQIQMQSQMQSITTSVPSRQAGVQQPGDIFEQSQQSSVVKKIEIKKIADEAPKLTNVAGNVSQPSENQTDENHKGGSELSSSTSHVIVEGGFGKIQPKIAGTEQNREDVEGDDDWASQEFVTMAALQNGRLSEKEMKELDVFKNYEPGEPTSRLYIKNLAKKVTEKDLRFIYGRYVNRNDELEKSMFYVQLLTGRMKGQAFITLPSESSAKEALKDTNGYQLQGKAMVVQFARSVKPKEKDDR